jgi:hypothetical protein
VAIETHFDPWFDAIQAPTPTDRATLACSEFLMAALHTRRPAICLCPSTAMPWAAFSRCWSAVAWSLRSSRPLSAVLGRCGWLLTLLGLLAKHHHPEPLEADRRLLQGKQQPKIPLEHLVQHAPIVGSQGIPGETCA